MTTYQVALRETVYVMGNAMPLRPEVMGPERGRMVCVRHGAGAGRKGASALSWVGRCVCVELY